jgi:CRP/FNR family transcriptional regulator/CRP/FNR family cyclic AMP-dependent transcriptional regulator
MKKRIELLSKVPLFRALNNDEIQKLAEVVIFKKYMKNQAILMEDDESANSMFVIVNGKIRISVSGYEGKDAILAIMEPGEYFGEMSVIDGEPRSASVYAVDPTELLVLRREDLLIQIEKNPKLALSMLIEFSRRLRAADTRITSLALLGVYGRVANIVIELAQSKGRKVGNMMVIENRPTHQEIAEMSGTTRETVSRVLGKLQRSGTLIVERDKIIILRMEELKNEEQERLT